MEWYLYELRTFNLIIAQLKSSIRALNDANNWKRLAVCAATRIAGKIGKSEFCEKSLKQVQ